MSVSSATMSTPAAPAVPDILQEHLEEMGFLAIQRRRLLFSAAPLRALGRLDERITAHRDGLAVGGADATAIAEELLAGDDPWLVAAAARVWLEQGAPEPGPARERIDAAGAMLPSWREALRTLADDAFQRFAPSAWVPASVPLLEAVVDARGFRGMVPPALADAARGHASPAVRGAFARHTQDPAAAALLLEDPEPEVRRRALWSLVRLDRTAALARVRNDITHSPPDPFAVRVLGLLGERNDGERLLALASDPAVAAEPALILATLTALRDLAQPARASGLLPLLGAKDEALAAVAREAFESLLGTPPEPDSAHPLPEGVTVEEAHLNRMVSALERGERRLLGVPFPWTGEAADRPLEFLWRAAVGESDRGLAWLRREVPDGFFAGAPDLEVLPGL